MRGRPLQRADRHWDFAHRTLKRPGFGGNSSRGGGGAADVPSLPPTVDARLYGARQHAGSARAPLRFPRLIASTQRRKSSTRAEAAQGSMLLRALAGCRPPVRQTGERDAPKHIRAHRGGSGDSCASAFGRATVATPVAGNSSSSGKCAVPKSASQKGKKTAKFRSKCLRSSE